MARTLNGKLTGRAASEELKDLRASLAADFTRRQNELKDRTQVVCQAIADRTTPEEYAAWWNSTPNDNEGFYAAACDKLSALEIEEILEWLDFQFYQTPEQIESARIQKSMEEQWETIPEIPL